MSIVQVNVSQQVGSVPNTLQRKGAFVSTGATTLTAGSKLLLTQLSDLTSVLSGSVSITAASTTWVGGVVTVTTAVAHGFVSNESVTISGFAAGSVGYNGTYTITSTGANTFTYPHAGTLTSPASGTGVATAENVSELVAMATTFFAQGSSVAVSILELGNVSIPAGVAALSAYIIANPNSFYRYLVPRGWDADSTFVTLASQYVSTTAKVYFHVTATLATYASFTPTNGKSVMMTIEAANIPATEFTSAAGFWVALSYRPSSTNQVTPFCYSYVYGVTPYEPDLSHQVTFKAANLNYITTGAEGGISNLILVNGTMCDGNPLNYWYSVDWMQINVDMDIINGSNNPLAPLYYTQQGVNRLEIVTQSTATRGVANGLAVGPVTAYALTSEAFTALLESGNAPVGVLVNAVPFISYVGLNPADYPVGLYSGLSISYTPARGFQNIVFNVNVSNFIP
jgi:hypothetical protein